MLGGHIPPRNKLHSFLTGRCLRMWALRDLRVTSGAGCPCPGALGDWGASHFGETAVWFLGMGTDPWADPECSVQPGSVHRWATVRSGVAITAVLAVRGACVQAGAQSCAQQAWPGLSPVPQPHRVPVSTCPGDFSRGCSFTPAHPSARARLPHSGRWARTMSQHFLPTEPRC